MMPRLLLLLLNWTGQHHVPDRVGGGKGKVKSAVRIGPVSFPSGRCRLLFPARARSQRNERRRDGRSPARPTSGRTMTSPGPQIASAPEGRATVANQATEMQVRPPETQLQLTRNSSSVQ